MQILNKIFNREAPTAQHKRSVKTDFITFLDSNNCKYDREDDREEKLERFYFDYQGGHYIAIIKDNNMGVDVNFPSFTDAPTSELQLVRAMCNRSNANSSILKYTYTFDETKDLVRVHLAFFCTAVYAEEMTQLLNACFYFQRAFCEEYENAKKNQDQYTSTGIERTFARNARERYLIAQQELNHDSQRLATQLRTSSHQPLQLGEFLATALDLEHCQCRLMTITRGTNVETIDSDIKQYSLAHLLIDDRQNGAEPFVHQLATATVTLTMMDEQKPDELSDMLLTITAQPAHADATSIYFHITATLTDANVDRASALNSRRTPQAISTLAAYDLASPEKKMQEFNYMWQDAQIKMRDGEELSDEQQLILDVTDANIGYCLYWGKNYMLQERFVEALRFFLNAYRAMNAMFFKINDELKSTFSELCYNIGFCYAELQQYQQAFYYLQMLENNGNVRHNSELINCLANNRDVRVFKIIDDIYDAIQEHFQKDEDIPEELQSFVNFLRRRRAYALIEFDELDNAEKAFNEMLDEPENSDYALGELAYIKRLRQSKTQADGSTTSTQADSDADHKKADETQ